MSTKKRAAIAAMLSAAAGSTAGAVASYCGMDIESAANLGAVVSGAVGTLLYDAFRLTSDGTAASGAPNAADDAEPDINNVSEGVSDTVHNTDEPNAQLPARHRSERGSAGDRKRDRHRKLRRTGRRRVDRDPVKKQDTHREGDDHGKA